MKKVLRQFRYYGNENSLNSANINENNLTTGDIFFASSELRTATIVSFGIQTIPGIKFYINDSTESIIIGPTGIYELNLSDGYEINSLRFSNSSLVNLFKENPNAYLIVDIIYETEE